MLGHGYIPTPWQEEKAENWVIRTGGKECRVKGRREETQDCVRGQVSISEVEY